VTPRSGSAIPDKKRQEPASVPSKPGKLGKQSEDNLVAGMKKSLESDESDSEDDDSDDDNDDDDDDDIDVETVPAKKQPLLAKGLFVHFLFPLIKSERKTFTLTAISR